MLFGLDAHLIDVEADRGAGLPTIATVGLADPAVREGIDRIRAALRHTAFKLPEGRLTINLAPAEVRKQGTSLDLAMAVALLVADGQLPPIDPATTLVAGELGLDGNLRALRGALSMALAAREGGRRTFLLPRANADEAALVPGIDAIGLGSLAEVAAWASGVRPAPARPDAARLLAEAGADEAGGDLAEVRGQAAARRALEIAAAGGHHLLLAGPPGAGKTMLARRLPGLLPPLALDEALEVTRCFSAAGLSRGLVGRRPFRAPHHGISFAGLTGGGLGLRPGEISLASHGVLYLDELPEFRRDALEALRQPLEEGRITVARVHGVATFPTQFSLVASMNPCACGFHGTRGGRCHCTPNEVRRYRARLSGPLFDRLDLVVAVSPVPAELLASGPAGEPSCAVRARVVAARALQRRRFGPLGATCNARMGPAEIEEHAALDRAERELLLAAARRLDLSARAVDRTRRVARTIADLAGEGRIAAEHVAEALQYRHSEGP